MLNRGHIALVKLAEEKEGFLAVSQNIDGECNESRGN